MVTNFGVCESFDRGRFDTIDTVTPSEDGPGPSNESARPMGNDQRLDAAESKPHDSEENATPDSTYHRIWAGVEWVVEHLAVLLLILGASAYVSGYLSVYSFAGELGIQSSDLGLDYRSHLIVTLIWAFGLIIVGLVITVPVVGGMALARGLRHKSAWTRALVAVLLIGVGVGTLLWFEDRTDLSGFVGGAGQSFLMFLVVGFLWEAANQWIDKKFSIPESANATSGDGVSPRRPNTPAIVLVALVGVLVGSLTVLLMIQGPLVLEPRGYADSLVDEDVDHDLWSPLGVVIQPVEIEIYGVTEIESVPKPEDGTEVLLLSSNGGKAVFIYKGKVFVEDSDGLTFVTPDSD